MRAEDEERAVACLFIVYCSGLNVSAAACRLNIQFEDLSVENHQIRIDLGCQKSTFGFFTL